jgi:hypothetical protein
MLPSCSKQVCAHKRMRRLVHPSWCQCLSGMLASSLHAMHACTVTSLSVRSFSASTHARSGVQHVLAHVEHSYWCMLRASARASATASTFSACAFAIAYAVWLGLAAVRSCMSVQASDVSSDVAPYLCRAIEPRTRAAPQKTRRPSAHVFMTIQSVRRGRQRAPWRAHCTRS